MRITNKTIVTLRCDIRDETGKHHEQPSQKPFSYLHNANNIIPALEQELTGRLPGEKLTVTLEPQKAYGERLDHLVGSATRSEFIQLGLSEDYLKPGSAFMLNTPTGKRPIKILDVDGENIKIDANHPLAGKTFTYDIDILNVRPATEQELANGQPQEGFGLTT